MPVEPHHQLIHASCQPCINGMKSQTVILTAQHIHLPSNLILIKRALSGDEAPLLELVLTNLRSMNQRIAVSERQRERSEPSPDRYGAGVLMDESHPLVVHLSFSLAKLGGLFHLVGFKRVLGTSWPVRLRDRLDQLSTEKIM